MTRLSHAASAQGRSWPVATIAWENGTGSYWEHSGMLVVSPFQGDLKQAPQRRKTTSLSWSMPGSTRIGKWWDEPARFIP